MVTSASGAAEIAAVTVFDEHQRPIGNMPQWGEAARLLVEGVRAGSKPTYVSVLRLALPHFHVAATNSIRMDRTAMLEYRGLLTIVGKAAATVNLHMAVLKRLAIEASHLGLLDAATLLGIQGVKGVPAEGERLGNWLTVEEAQRLLDAPSIALNGLRDRAALGLLLGCGLRRHELVKLTVGHVQQRRGRWVIVDMLGKGGRRRSVPVPAWVKARLDEYWEALTLRVNRASGGTAALMLAGEEWALWQHRRGRSAFTRQQWTSAGVYIMCEKYAKKTGLKFSPHDLRRTFAQLAKGGGGKLEQIQKSLGHKSVKTTETYVNESQDLENAPGDVLGLR